MGTPIDKENLPVLLDQVVHFAAPKFWEPLSCIRGRVKYIEASKNPKILYLTPLGKDYLIRVDVDCYNLAEKIEENEQHPGH